jgi:pre-mRNA-splicing factor CWC22
VNTSNIKNIVVELFSENLLRGKGLFARSLLKAQAASPMFSHVYAAVVSVINSKLPALGSLVLNRLVSNFKKSYRRNDKTLCISSIRFIAHLVNQQVAHEIVALEILALLLEKPTDDSVEIAVAFVKEVGAFLTEVSPKATHATFERFRAILRQSQLDKRVQYMIEVLFQVRKDKFKDYVSKPEELDLVEEEDQITHYISLEDELETEEGLDVFKYDPEYEENEAKYQSIKKEILGDSEEEESGEEVDAVDDSEEVQSNTVQIQDQTQTNLVNLRKTIYLTLKSSLDFEEACHKLLKLHLKPGQEKHLCSMVIESCSQERSYDKYFGLIGERFCKVNRIWADCYCGQFHEIYMTIHRYETNRIRNIAKFFAHLLSSDALPWSVFEIVKLTEDDTTSSSRIFLKILFEELLASLGTKVLTEKMNDDELQEHYVGIFPMDDPKNIRFSINYFTSIGLGFLT